MGWEVREKDESMVFVVERRSDIVDGERALGRRR